MMKLGATQRPDLKSLFDDPVYYRAINVKFEPPLDVVLYISNVERILREGRVQELAGKRAERSLLLPLGHVSPLALGCLNNAC